MADLIKRDEVLNIINDAIRSQDHSLSRLKDRILALPTIESEPKHGRWIRKENKRYYWFECSECGYPPPLDKFKREWFSEYCPNCGARMDEVEE